MTMTPADSGILLVDDGELESVARVLDSQGIAYRRLRGGQIPDEIAPPRDLLIVTPRRVDRVRRGSPADARPGRPLRIIAVEEDSPAMRRRLRRAGLHLLIRLPADPEIWRLLVARALYRGSERRSDARVAVGSPVRLVPNEADAPPPTTLLDLSNRGCRLQTTESLAVGDSIEFTIPVDGEAWCEAGPLTLAGEVRRMVWDSAARRGTYAVVFDAQMSEATRIHLTSLINHWASGPRAQDMRPASEAPAIPACQLPSIPDLTLDDETDPPISAGGQVQVSLGNVGDKVGDRAHPSAKTAENSHDDSKAQGDGEQDDENRRSHARAHFASSVVAETGAGPFVLIGRDLSAGGMRIEPHPDLAVGDRFRVALHGPAPNEPLLLEAEIVRDDGAAGFGVTFGRISREMARELEKLVACLPDVESLEDGEVGGLGAVLSEILED